MSNHYADPSAHPRVLTPSYTDRRRMPRVEVMSRISAQLVALDIPVTLINLSVGGFLMKSPVDFPVGTIATFRLIGRQGQQTVVRARAVHTMQAVTGDTITYVVGLHFVEQLGADGDQMIAEIIASLRAD